MDRRSFLTSTIKKEAPAGDPPLSNKYANKSLPKFKNASSLGLTPYSGPWTMKQARHLLNRTMFGASRSQVASATASDMNSVVAQLLAAVATPAPPAYNYYNEGVDPDTPMGDTWVTKPHNTLFNNLRIASLKDWWLKLMLEQDISIQEKMTLFLQNTVPIQFYSVLSAQFAYRYNVLCREHSIGNYKTFVKKVSTDTAMLIYLNGYKNQKNAPDENYARELQELFTVGKGPDSQYTEEDVKQAAKVLTGFNVNTTTGAYQFNAQLHDTGNKQFSAFYNNTVITGRSGAAGEDELTDLINMLFSNNEVARHIMRSLYRFFVYYVIDDEIETNIITPLADTFRDSGYEFAPVLEKLFKSEHFYDAYNGGCVIKNPIDYTLGMVKNFNITMPGASDVAKQYYGLRAIAQFNQVLALDLGDPPNVAGWEAYRTAPIYHEIWINSVTISYRNQFFELLLSPAGYNYKTINLRIDYLAFTETVPNAEDPNLLISNLVDIFSTDAITATQAAGLKTILLSNQAQDHYWTDAWNQYIASPGNQQYKATVQTRLYSFYRYFLSLAENQLI